MLEDLMKRFGADVWNFAYFLTRSSDTADDLAQEVFLAAYRSLYNFRGGDESLKSWLLKITRNKTLHHLQSAFMRRVKLPGRLPFIDAAPAAEQIYFEKHARNLLWEAVLDLPLKYREVLILDYHYGLSNQEIAQLSGIAEGTVKSRIHRAKKKLAAHLGRDER
ncbi:RNA polymerase sigma factor [Paenibacillus herberti]|nr:RNA polymerase sigma factor [Paenibacillus herberti]